MNSITDSNNCILGSAGSTTTWTYPTYPNPIYTTYTNSMEAIITLRPKQNETAEVFNQRIQKLITKLENKFKVKEYSVEL